MNYSLFPRELEKKNMYQARVLASKEDLSKVEKVQLAHKLWKEAWAEAQVTVVSSQGDFFIN